MEVTIKLNGQALSVDVSMEVYEYLDRADHKAENLAHEQRRHWDGREFDEYIIATEDPAPPVPALRTGRVELFRDCTDLWLLKVCRPGFCHGGQKNFSNFF